MGDERDLAPGQQIVQYITPFLVHLSGSGLTKKTVQKHVDNLWVLGGEIIRDPQETSKLRKKPVSEIIATLLENNGPRLYHCDSEEHQRSFESTCRKLRRYLNGPLAGV